MTTKKHKIKHLLPFLLITAIYLLTLKGVPGNLHPNGTGLSSIQVNKPPFETSMERGRYAQIVSIVESGNLDVNEFHKFLKPDIAWYNGNFLSTFPPGVAILSSPLFWLGKFFNLAQVFTSLTPLVFSLLTAYLTYLTCLKLGLNKKSGAFAAIVYAFGSVAWPYSVSLSAHPVSAFVMILGVYLLLGIISKPSNHSINLSIIGVLFGMCFLIDYPNILIFLPMASTAFLTNIFRLLKKGGDWELEINIKEKLPFLKSFVLIFSLFVAFNLYYYQKPIAFTNTYSIKFLEVSGINLEEVSLTNEIFSGRDYSTRFTLKKTVSGIYTLLLSQDRGLLTYSPVYILAILGFAIIYRKNKRWALVVFTSFILNLLVYGSYDDPWGGWSFGPRYLIVILPVLAVFCGATFEFLVNRYSYFSKIIIFTMLLFSSSVALLGASTTNAVPPSIEVINTSIPSNYIYNWNFLNNNGVSSFVYNILPVGIFTPQYYFYMVFTLLFLFELWIVFTYKSKVFD